MSSFTNMLRASLPQMVRVRALFAAFGFLICLTAVAVAQSGRDGFEPNTDGSIRSMAAQIILAPLAGDFTNRQAAASVLGQPNFTTNSAGTTASKFNIADNAVVDPVSKKAFVVEEGNNRVLRFSSAAALTTGAAAEAVFGQTDFVSNTVGTAANKFNVPTDVSIDAAGRLWVVDFFNNRVLRFDNAATKATGAAADGVLGQTNFVTGTSGTTQNKFNNPAGIFADSSGRLWVADFNNNRVLRFDNAAAKANGANADAVLGQPNFTTGVAGTTASKMNNPYGVTLDTVGRLHVAEFNNNRVLRFDAAATKANGAPADVVLGQPDFTTATSGTTASKMNSPTGVATDANGRLYVADNFNNRVIIFNNAGTLTNGAPANVVLGQPNFTTGTANTGGVSAISMNQPFHLSFDETSGSLFVGDSGNNRVLRFAAPITPTAASVTISGRAITSTRRGIRNVLIRLTDSNGNTRMAVSSSFGYYRFEDVAAGETYIISASAKRYTFSQQTQVLNINEDTEEINFIANPITR